jgi:hypothetical protein
MMRLRPETSARGANRDVAEIGGGFFHKLQRLAVDDFGPRKRTRDGCDRYARALRDFFQSGAAIHLRPAKLFIANRRIGG